MATNKKKSQKVFRRSDLAEDVDSAFDSTLNADATKNFQVASSNPLVKLLNRPMKNERRVNALCAKLHLPGKYTGGSFTPEKKA